MATLTTVDGVEITFRPDSVEVVAPAQGTNGAVVYGLARAVITTENPRVFLDRLGIAAKFAARWITCLDQGDVCFITAYAPTG